MMKFEVDETKMDTKSWAVIKSAVTALGFKEIEEPVEDNISGYVDMRVKKPDVRDVYYFITPRERVDWGHWLNEAPQNDSWLIGNIYNTREQAEYALERMKVRAELERLSLESWGNNRYSSDSLFFDIKIGLGTGASQLEVHASSFSIYSNITFATAENAEEAIRTVGADRIKKYLFNVWD